MLRNKRIVLTGGNSGIGLEILRLVAAEKSNTVFVADLCIDRLGEFGDNVIGFVCDVSSCQAVDSIFAAADKKMGGIDIFYANAGYPYYELMDYTDWDRTRVMFETNVFSPIYSYQKYREYLNGKDGHFAITVSAIGKLAIPGYTTYSSTKFAMNGFQQGIRHEMPKNMKLTCLYPIATDTNFFKAANPLEFERPFPVQSPKVVARKMVKGLEKGKKSVSPSPLFSVSLVLFAVLPFTKSIYISLERKKLERFVAKNSGMDL